MSDWLSSLKPGDEVLCSGRFDNIVTIEAVTKTQVVAGGDRFSRKTGALIGYRGGFFHPSIHKLTQEKRDEIERQRLIFKLCQLSARHFENVPTDAIRDFASILDKSSGVKVHS